MPPKLHSCLCVICGLTVIKDTETWQVEQSGRRLITYIEEPNLFGQRRTFSKFRDLPAEIRRRIWDFARVTAEGSEVVEVVSTASMAGADYDEAGALKCQLVFKSPPRKGLQVCYETRSIMLGKLLISRDVNLCLDPAADALYFGPNVAWGQVHRLSSLMKTEQLSSLTDLVFEEDKLAAFMLGCANRSPDLSVLSGLRSLSITMLDVGPWSQAHQTWRIDKSGEHFHCDKCRDMERYVRGASEVVGKWCWKFPTLKEVESTLRLSANAAEDLYWKVLSDFDGRYSLFAWLWDYTHGKA